VAVPQPVIRFWRALDDVVGTVRPTRWGAVVTDARFRAIWDANYARIDGRGPGPTVDEVERDLLPALAAVGATVEHVVAFDPDAAHAVLTELSTRGHRLGWDLVMTTGSDAPTDADPAADVAVSEVDRDDAVTWRDVRSSLIESFGIEAGDPIEQLLRLERDVLAPAGKRWFGVRTGGRWVSLAAVLVLEGVGYVDNVATDPALRGRGYATALTAHVTRAALEQGVGTVFLLADPDEAPTVRLYERVGFRGVARLASTRGPVPTT
jgi:ribosomal protein S18 acetylase RimI-like enzyme